MYCFNCGERVVRGKSFCHHCGAPIPAIPRRPPQPSEPERGWRERRGSSVAIVAACVMLLLAAAFVVKDVMGDSGSATREREARRPAITTSGAALAEATTSTVAGADEPLTTTSPAGGPAGTAATAAAPSTETTAAAPSTETTAAEKGMYAQTVETMVDTLTQYESRLSYISDTIVHSENDVPDDVWYELNLMAADLNSQRGDLERARAYAPAGYEVSHQWLDVAASYLMYRARYAVVAVEALRATDRPAADEAFVRARDARDGFLAAFATYQQLTRGRGPTGSAASR